MSSLIKSTIIGLLVLSLWACSSTQSAEQINYRKSEITPTLEIPPDLISRSTDKNLSLPGSKVGLASNAGRFVETGNLNIEKRSLPLFDNIHIKGHADLHWLEVPEKAEKLVPLVRAFWAEQGFRLIVDEPAVGLMETEWMSTKSGSDSFLAAIFESLAGADTKDQYVTRFERNSDNSATLIFLAHRGQELIIEDVDEKSVIHKTGRSQGWQRAPSDPTREYEMLSRLMIYLGMQDEAVKAELEKIGLFAARASIKYDEEDEETYLLVNHGFQQTWNRVLHEFNRLSIPVTAKEKHSNDGTITIQRESLQFDETPEQDSRLQQVIIAMEGSSSSNTTRIDLINEQGSMDQSATAKQILQFLLTQLK